MTYLFIFLAKIVEVAFMTLRVVLITKGEKVYGSIIGFFEVMIWLSLIGSVLIGIQDDPLRMVVYGLGFACGNYVGSYIEEKLALGLMTLNIIVTEENGIKLARILRDKKIGVTVIGAEGIEKNRHLLIVHAKRKRKNEILRLIDNSDIPTVISVNDTKVIYGGYGIRK
ncbi:hypothetical protein GOQ27_04505 [Clostridium sp. D2Q-11]|uniref:Uncharacterized protein n=1 Tax=Anaeromonas frigoriresistens TaxID=2683708 RepID=A0A942Z897_9FIRM|nr:DUF5698 domain-containing protein [Anaeromonas frigoriresistens]MBS4537710.1 hypothetical protein [Anaeromonas frigoriresistens]